MSDGFLGRWSRRKLDAKQGKVVAPEQPVEPVAQQVPADSAVPGDAPTALEAVAAPASEVPPAPTLEDVGALTAESDFSRFVAPDVTPAVKNAALKKLFADPRYNVMDGLDVYIDDYSRADPLPSQLARQLAGAAVLGLFDAPGAPQPAQARDVADDRGAGTVPQSETDSAAGAADDADPDLRLQQDDAAEGGATGPGTA
ncbi:MAG TPA: DUF3306 domain-containing protein [Ramlibacter sp.]|nr:DUF3306 domain-containing protein [Ramlibacter sp.]